MKREFIVERSGRSFVLYAGLLEEAHSQGLKAIRTRLLQAPAVENGQVAIVHAEVETDRGVYCGIGDASPDNVTRMLAPHFIRMAETRAKARALRDAVNVAVTALEELGDAEADTSSHEDGAGRTNGLREPAQSRFDDDRDDRPLRSSSAANHGTVRIAATPAQLKAIYVIGRSEQQLSEEEVDDLARRQFGRPTNDLSKREASELIDALKQLAATH